MLRQRGYRIAVDVPGTRFALPEVMLGILPGWGGVKRLPKAVGPSAALDLMMTGRSIDARRAKKIGLVDDAVPPRVMESAARTTVLAAPKPRALPFHQRLLNGPLKGVVAAMARAQLQKRARREHYPAPYAILDLWEKYDGDPFLPPPQDPASIGYLVEHPTAKNLIRIFGLQERLKALGKTSDFAAKRVHVIGAGTMGGDIAAVCALRGLTVTLQDTAPERLAPAMKRAAELFGKRLRDRLRVRDAADRLIPDLQGDGVRHADVIIEAIFENLPVKQDLFAAIEARAKRGAILATNTSSLKLADIGRKMQDPSRLIGLHFFNPVPQLQLVEVVAGAATKPEWASEGAAFVRQIDKLPLPVQDSPGFLVNRVLGPYMLNAFRMLDEGVKAETIDKAAERFGMPMGPITLADTVGLDIVAAAGKALSGPEATPPKRLAALLAGGKLGKKTGEGFYRWQKGKPAKGAADLFTADRFAHVMHHDERGLGSIAQPQQALTQRRHRTGIVLILVVGGVQRVEHDHLRGDLTGGVEKVIESLRCAQQIAGGTRIHQQVQIGGCSHGAAHHRQSPHKLWRGQFELADQHATRCGDGEAGAVLAGGQRQCQIGHQQALAHLGLAAHEQNARRRQQSRLDPSRRRRSRLLGE